MVKSPQRDRTENEKQVVLLGKEDWANRVTGHVMSYIVLTKTPPA
jgi:hypothetical protein